MESALQREIALNSSMLTFTCFLQKPQKQLAAEWKLNSRGRAQSGSPASVAALS
jgi:hypothetical protein